MVEWTVFSYEGDNSYPPVLFCLNHNLQTKNVSSCSSKTILKKTTYFIKEISNMDYTAIITYTIDPIESQYIFERGFLYINNMEYPIKHISKYRSLQIENSCYDNINCIQI